MPLPVRWTDEALADLREIGDYIARDDQEAAARWVGKLVAATEAAGFMPRAGRVVPELDDEAMREVIKGNYRIIYHILDDAIEVVAVFEGHRSLEPPTRRDADDGVA